MTEPPSVDDAIRIAAKAAIDAGEIERAHALLDMLATGQKPHAAPVVSLKINRTRRP